MKIYAQIACITPFDNPDWEKLYWFLKFLIPKLHVKDRDRDALDTLCWKAWISPLTIWSASG